jgi:transcription-repair coupling factor (superfamily II helicase)
LLRWLTEHGWERQDAVELPGEFSLRGGILDIFPIDAPDPLRVEWFGDEVESIREFSVESQRSLREIERIEITAMGANEAFEPQKGAKGHFVDVAPPGTWYALLEPNELREQGQQYLNRLEDARKLFSVEETWKRLVSHPTVVISNLPYSSVETTCSLHVESIERFSGDVTKVRDELDRTATSEEILIACHNEAEAKRLREILADGQAAKENRLHLCIGRLSAGFRWVSQRVVAISGQELFHRTETRRLEPKRRHESRAIDSFLELREGDYTVHLSHGIGVFRGMRMLDKNDQLEEHLCLEFADNALVYVPASKIDLVQKYVGSSQAPPRLSKIGGLSWERRKQAVQHAVKDLAADLLDVQASRQAQPGVAYPPDTEWQREFEAAFPFEETHDQLMAIEEIRKDMESARPMDRLICGDVGYGKTEVAMRAAFKAVDFGKQVAVLVPTTILAQQHWRTFRERMSEFPFEIAVLSRFQTKAEQRATIARTAEGAVDILIGTHRILSKDVEFAELGLVIIDEEQRFGVEHKERLKQLRSQVDVLTMTATPIPRTLHSALLGIRDISNLETPPHDRQAVETRISRFDPQIIRHAILRELNRDGQIYFVHNRVGDIWDVARRLESIVPEARIAVIHGQMHEQDIETGMLAFLERRADILLATTIIESGLDIPNANTIFIDEGDKYGLADMHQLRGRVGRSANRAYCHVLVDERKIVNPDAHRRLKAIEEFSALGSGFKIALRDLEIRGAGNILGTQQSGHIAAVGYELYCQLLENAVRALKKQPIQTFLDVTVELPWEAYLPQDYLPGERFRVDAYRRLARVRDLDAIGEFKRELEDRFGPVPPPAQNFLDLAELRILSQIWQVEAVRPDEEGFLVLTYRNARRIETLEKMRHGELKVVDTKSAYIRVPPSQRNAKGYAEILKRILQPM